MKTQFVLFVLLSSWILGCILPIHPQLKVNFQTASFPREPVNFSELNSADNDYNSAGPPLLIAPMPFIFSSDRVRQTPLPTRGKFDFLAYQILFYFNQNNGNWERHVYSLEAPAYQSGTASRPANFIYSLLQQVNTSANELGPYVQFDNSFQSSLFLYASDSTGNLDIYSVAYPLSYFDSNTPFKGSKPVPARLLNSDKDDAYPTLTSDNTHILFTSNRRGDFDLFSVPLGNQPVQDALATEPTFEDTPQPMDLLNSALDDKCPYINGSLLVFTSNRPGGYGGFDLYFSRWVNGHWSAPVNLGPFINSASDEYRPVIFRAPEFENDLMIFSSNRPGGKGGFDLYYVGIPKMWIDS